jgi:hypothetical protein
MGKVPISIVVDHELGDVVHELLLVVLLRKPHSVDLVCLALPEVTHHRTAPFLLLHDVY